MFTQACACIAQARAENRVAMFYAVGAGGGAAPSPWFVSRAGFSPLAGNAVFFGLRVLRVWCEDDARHKARARDKLRGTSRVTAAHLIINKATAMKNHMRRNSMVLVCAGPSTASVQPVSVHVCCEFRNWGPKGGGCEAIHVRIPGAAQQPTVLSNTHPTTVGKQVQ